MSEQDRDGREAPAESQPTIESAEFELPGEAACWAHLVCPECGAVMSEGHRAGCAWKEADSGKDTTA